MRWCGATCSGVGRLTVGPAPRTPVVRSQHHPPLTQGMGGDGRDPGPAVVADQGSCDPGHRLHLGHTSESSLRVQPWLSRSSSGRCVLTRQHFSHQVSGRFGASGLAPTGHHRDRPPGPALATVDHRAELEDVVAGYRGGYPVTAVEHDEAAADLHHALTSSTSRRSTSTGEGRPRPQVHAEPPGQSRCLSTGPTQGSPECTGAGEDARAVTTRPRRSSRRCRPRCHDDPRWGAGWHRLVDLRHQLQKASSRLAENISQSRVIRTVELSGSSKPASSRFTRQRRAGKRWTTRRWRAAAGLPAAPRPWSSTAAARRRAADAAPGAGSRG